MIGRILGAILCLVLMSATLHAWSSPLPHSPLASLRIVVPVQQQQPLAGTDTTTKLDRIFREISQLRQSVFKVFGTSNELAAVPDLTREVALGEQAIRAARHIATDAEMHALIQYLDADGDMLFSLIARHPSDPALVNTGLTYTTARRARFAREQFQEVFDWKATVAANQPALWQKLRQAQDRFTDLSVLPTFTGNFRRDQIQHEADAIADLEKSVFMNGGLQRSFSMPSSADILADMGVDQRSQTSISARFSSSMSSMTRSADRRGTERWSAGPPSIWRSSAMRERR